MTDFNFKTLLQTFPSDGREITLGKSAGNRPINLLRFGTGSKNILLLAGVHGDEYEGIDLVERFIRFCKESFRNQKVSLWIIPSVNPDGKENNSRLNDNGVDLNRNLPTKDWSPVAATPRYQPGPRPNSEPENQILTQLIDWIQPLLIISAHSYKYPMININGDCTGVADAMRQVNDLPIKPDIGYPTPGSLGTYTGWERNIPTITLEVPQYGNLDVIWEKNRGALAGAINYVANHLPK